MKAVLSILILVSTTVFASDGIIPRKSLPDSRHEIKSVTPQDDLPAGKCIVKGYVKKDGESGEVMPGVLVSNLSRTKSQFTDSTGYYELLIDATDTTLFAFKSEFTEHVIWQVDFKERHVYEINFYLTEDWGMLEMDKPVIYLYSETDQMVNIHFEPKGKTVFTYPEYDPHKGWNAKVNTEGVSVDNRSYPYLFWEASTKELEYHSKENTFYGALISTDTITSYFENSLTRLGLSHIEQADFITYWLPKVKQSKFAFIQFVIDEDYESHICKMDVSPKPESERRVYMIFTLFAEKPSGGNFQPQNFPAFNREGFTLIEWGGTQKKNCEIFSHETVQK